MQILILDAQGGGIGRMLTEQIKKAMPEQRVIAVGTNAAATSAMLKAGADQAATGENAIRVCAERADLILAPLGMMVADSMLGEVTAAMSDAIGRASARKILIPASRCGITVAGVQEMNLADYISLAVQEAVRLVHAEV